MPDRGKFWSPVPDWPTAKIHKPGLDITVAQAGTIRLISGDLSKFLALHHDGANCLSPRDTIASDRYALRLAPDRLLSVQGAAVQAIPGWSPDGIAATEVSDGFVLFDITGPAAADIMALGAEYDFTAKPSLPMESAAMVFAGLKVLIARTAGGWRLHVERPSAAALWHWLEYATQDQPRLAASAGASSSQQVSS